ncbi:MAG: DUF924 domain-containing protein [Marinobacterium sp.]|nr:DUF924 domain-containing protein [Marinobacterium sp.]
MREQIEEILRYWFGDIVQGDVSDDRHRLWWSGDAQTDRATASLFGRQVREALNGDLNHWAENPRGRLALIILLDQFTRMVYRGDADAFAGDVLALRLCQQGLERQHDRALDHIERTFFYMPLEHAESLVVQDQSIECFTRLQAEAPPHLWAKFQNSLEFAHQHRDMVARFGRFPHRNTVLQRTSTPEELAWLNSNHRPVWGR